MRKRQRMLFDVWAQASRKLKKFIQRRDGAAALEFAIVGPIHLALILAILEAGLICTRIVLVDHAVAKAAKYIYVGPQAGRVVTQAMLEEYVCDNIGRFVVNCRENLSLELTPITSFRSLPTTDAPCRDTDVDIAPRVQFNTGGANDIVFMRVCLTTPVVTPGLGLGLQLGKTSTNKYQIISALAFVNEPF